TMRVRATAAALLTSLVAAWPGTCPAKVNLITISGSINPAVDDFIRESVRVTTAEEMFNAVCAHAEDADVIVKAAAVADYHVPHSPGKKIKKTAARITLELDPTPDILAEVGRNKGGRLLIGFAAETENLIAEASRKLKTKNCDMVVANLVGVEGTGFESDRNEVTLVLGTGETLALPPASKREIADRIFDQAPRLRLAPRRTE
ncbi:MAG: hypothetical protein HY822_03055, partial [Acidobacteria bacterium]|nr:hypothetical protein [Acidobacteriota bacterium]